MSRTTDLTDLLNEPSLPRLLESLRLRLHEDQSRTDYDTKDDPSPMDTLGTLIDKLITVDMKMWYNQERLYEIRRMSSREFTDRYGDSLDELHAVIKRCCDLNVQRARLMDAIDTHFSEVVNGQREALVNAQLKTY
jgi:hypothetical protein